MYRLAAAVAAVITVSAAGFAPAGHAADVPYAGKWAAQVEQCSIEQGAEGAPLMLTQTTYDQGEAHCKFSSVAPEAGAFVAIGKCSVEGDEQDARMTLLADGDKLTIRDEAGERTLVKCP